MDTNPENFRRDQGIPCPVCTAWLPSFEMQGIHYAKHTDAEKEAAWARVPDFFASKRRVFALVPVGER